MNKKIKVLIFLAIIVALIPLGYKQYIDKTIISKINSLNNKGFAISKQKDTSGYLSVVQSYKLVISNPDTIYDVFLSKLFNPGQEMMIKKVLSSFNGSEMRVDLNILNFPTSHQDAIKIYLTSLPPNLMLRGKSDQLLQQISKFLKDKGVGESISINALGKMTSIKLKNIDKQFDIKNDNIEIKLKDYLTSIKRFDLYHDNYAFKTTNKLFNFKVVSNASNKFSIGYKNLKCSVDRKDIYNYNVLCNLDKFYLKSKKYKEQTLVLDDIFGSSSSSLEKNSINYTFKYKIKDINFNLSSKYKKGGVSVKNLVYKGSISGIDKKLVDEIGKLSYINSKPNLNGKYRSIIQKILNHGFVFDITKLGTSSIEALINKKTTSIGAVKMDMNLKLNKNDIRFFNKTKPIKILKYITMRVNIHMKKKDYEFLNSLDKRKRAGRISKLVKYQGDDAVFVIKFSNGKLSINDKRVF